MMRYHQQVRAVVLRKGTTHIGGKIGDFAVASRGTSLAYALEISTEGSRGTETVYLDRSRSKDYYRIPIDCPLELRIGKYGDRLGRWLDRWTLPNASSPND